MYVQISTERVVRTESIIAVVAENRRGTDQVRSVVVTDKGKYASPYRTQALMKKIEEGRL